MSKIHGYSSIPLFTLLLIVLTGFNACYDDVASDTSVINRKTSECTDCDGSPLLRETKFGLVKGTEAENTWAWLGIPYAKPPVGALRWRAPKDPAPWDGVKETGAFCSICTQYGNVISETGQDSLGNLFFDGRIVGSEDCLYLNIWRPRTEEKLPVFVFIHGGANMIGRSDLSIYNGARFASMQNFVVVTIAYRLGNLGWFAHPALRTGDPLEDSGNFGTLDIIKALAWVQDNIGAFGGDAGNVTICGQSAGAMNIISLLVSPLAKGLFHRAIPMSGFPIYCPMGTAEARAEKILLRLMLQDKLAGNLDEMLALMKEKGDGWVADYLRSKSIAEVYPPCIAGPTGINLDGGLLAFISMMGVYDDGVVVPDSPMLLISQGKYNRVPIMMGCTEEELKLFIPFFIVPPGKLNTLLMEFDPDNPDFHLKDLLEPVMWPLLPLYEPLALIGKPVFQNYGIDYTATRYCKYQSDVYAYKFAWDEEPQPFDFFIGAAHAMDIPFVFQNFITDRQSLCTFAWSTANEAGRMELSNAMMSYYAQFARTGNPNRSGSGLTKWTPWNCTKGADKRIIFDTGGLKMSSEAVEPGEVPSVQDVLADLDYLFTNQ